MCSPPKVKFPSITVYPLFTLFYLPPTHLFPLVISILLSISMRGLFFFKDFIYLLLERE